MGKRIASVRVARSLILSPILTLVLIGAQAATASFNTDRSSAGAVGSFPRGPRVEMTPGSLCKGGNAFRYPEHIRYCNRNVESRMKQEIIREYDQEFGYSVRAMPRGAFKIDHYIPLCAGGSNEHDNLWPQHASVYKITDPLEPLVCEKMSSGHLSQAEAVRLIKEAKNDLSKVEAILIHVESL